MAGTIIVPVGLSGLTLTAQLYPITADTLADSYALTEYTNRRGLYSAAVSGLLSGDFYCNCVDSGSNILWTGFTTLSLTSGNFLCGDYAWNPRFGLSNSDPLNANITQWSGVNVASPNIAGIPKVDTCYVSGIPYTVRLTIPEVNLVQISGIPVSFGNIYNANVTQWSGVYVPPADAAGYPAVNVVKVSGELVSPWAAATATTNVNVVKWQGDTVPLSNVPGYPDTNIVYVDGMPINFTDTMRANVVQWSGVNVIPATLQGMPSVDVEYVGGVLQQITNYLDSKVSQIPSGVLYYNIPEPTGVFAWEANLSKISAWLGALSRNKVTQTENIQTLYNDSGTAVASGTTTDDGIIFTREEWL